MKMPARNLKRPGMLALSAKPGLTIGRNDERGR